MGKFLVGLIVGIVVGVLAMVYSPDLPQEVRATLANVSALVLRGTEQAAEGLGEAADEVADEARQAGGGEADRTPEAPREPTTPGTEPPVGSADPGSGPAGTD